MKAAFFINLLLKLFFECSGTDSFKPPCDSQIYCDGELLKAVQLSEIFRESKYFVDMKLKYTENVTLYHFNQFVNEKGRLSREDVKEFVGKTFDPIDSDLIKWLPTDFQKRPKYIDKIKDYRYKDFAIELTLVWRNLCRRFKAEVRNSSELYSAIWVPYPFIIPATRRREYYYYESYWIIMGLLYSDMHQTARGMIENFIYLMETYDNIPEAGRKYFMRRSGPPMLIPMMRLYHFHTGDNKFLKKYICVLEEEFVFWTTKRMHNITIGNRQYTVATYGDDITGPRPEQYRYDYIRAQQVGSDRRNQFYSELHAGSESVWAFSSRWFQDKNVSNMNKSPKSFRPLRVRTIVPVDLNAILCWSASLLAEFFDILNDQDKMHHYSQLYYEMRMTMTDVLYKKIDGIWLDYNLLTNKRVDYYYLSNVVPLFTECFESRRKEKIGGHVTQYLLEHHALHSAGIPMSLDHSGLKWDYPNAIAPYQYFAATGLYHSGHADAKKLALELMSRWIQTNYLAYKDNYNMYDKYDVLNMGKPGVVEEYGSQVGHGWSNGVIISLLAQYGDLIAFKEGSGSTTISVYGMNVLLCIAFFVILSQ